MQALAGTKKKTKDSAKNTENTRLKEIQKAQKAEQKTIKSYSTYLNSAAKNVSSKKGKGKIATRGKDGKPTDKEVDATIIGNGEFFVHGNPGSYSLTQTSSGLSLANPKTIKDAKKIYAGITDQGEDWSKPITDLMKVKAGNVKAFVEFGDLKIRSVPSNHR